MAKVRIYQPDKTAMQSGKAKTRLWRMDFVAETPYFIEPLMGWTGMRDTTRELKLTFPTRESAIAYAEANKLEYEVKEPHKRSQVKKAYADNFKYVKTS